MERRRGPDELPIEDILTVKHDVIPLDGADVSLGSPLAEIRRLRDEGIKLARLPGSLLASFIFCGP